MTEREAIEILSRPFSMQEAPKEILDAHRLAISALEKQEAIKSCTPPSDDWEHYADRLHDIAYRSGYEQGKKDAEQERWIPCKEGLPKTTDPVNVTWVNNDPVSYYEDIKGKRFTATAHYHREKWWWYSSVCQDLLDEYGKSCMDDEIDEAIEILAWRPLPEAYQEGEA